MNKNTLKEFFFNFVRSRSITRHFHRLIMLESFSGTDINRDVPPTLTEKLSMAAQIEVEILLGQLNSHFDGLSESQADFVRGQVGLNQIAQDEPLRWWQHLWRCYKTPFDLLLTFLAIVSYITEDMKATIVISMMVVLSVMIRFWQESNSNRSADKLKAMVSNTATVIRRDIVEDAMPDAERYFGVHLHPQAPSKQEVPIKYLVPGDVIVISAGDMIPADCRVLTAKDLFVSQAAMTGESLPVEKFARLSDSSVSNILEMDNLLFMGTNVVSGSATAVIVTTGNSTYFGALAQRVTFTDRTTTQFQNGVNQVAWLLIRFMVVMAPLVLFINGVTKHDWLQAMLFAMSIAVGLTPEMLPMIVTSTLAKGAVLLSRHKVIVKRLDAIQNFGAMDVLCTDKTGTLTQDRICLARHTDIWGAESDEVLQYAYLNSYYQTGLKNLLDVAVLQHSEVHGQLNPTSNYHKVDEIPFDFQRRRMSVVVARKNDDHLLICKGAVEEILSVCTYVRHDDVNESLTPDMLKRVASVTASLNADGLRVVAVASKKMSIPKDTYGVSDESDLTLVGYVAFLDPPKESTLPALEALAIHGVTVKVLTGDNELVTAKICREVGLPVDKILLGSDFDRMSESELTDAVEHYTVFAKLTPAHKEKVVRLLKSNGHVVGFMGDGINDAPALRSADIGISVDTAVDIAKEAADIILLEKSLMVLEEGIIEGRKTFANMLKYIKMTASSNFGNVFSVLVASAFIPFLPMLPMHLLVQNLLYDISQIAIPFDNVDEELLKSPQSWNPSSIGRFMLYFGPISSVFDIVTFCVMWFVFGASTLATQTLFQSGWFLEGLLTQTLIVHMIRTQKVPFFQSRASSALTAMTLGIMTAGIFLVMGPFAHYFKLKSLPLSYYPILIMILFGYMLLTQLIKGFYTRKFGWQ